MTLLERFKKVSGDELGIRPGLALVELATDAKQNEVSVGGRKLIIAEPETHKLDRAAKKAKFVTVLAASSEDELGLEPGNVVLVSQESITTFSVFGRLVNAENKVGVIQSSSVLQVIDSESRYDDLFQTLNEGCDG